MVSAAIEDHVSHLFGTSIELHVGVADCLAQQIAKAGQRLAQGLLSDKKILICGNGASSATCLHFTSALIHHFEVERPPLPVIALNTDHAVITAIAKEGGFSELFAKQVQALGQEGDSLIVLTTSGNNDSILKAVDAANDRGMDTIALSGRDGGILANHLGPEDIEIRVPSDNDARIREIHLFVLHCFCDLIDQLLFGQLGE